MKKLLLLLGGVSCVIAVSVGIYMKLEASFMEGVDRTNDVRIVELTSSNSQADFEMPIGSVRRFLISRPLPGQGEYDTAYQFDGRLTVEVDGRSIYSVAIGSDSAEKCNWLDRQGYLAEVLDMDSPDALDTIQPGTKCRVLVELEAEPEVERAIWLSYVYKNRDLAKKSKKPRT